MGILLGKVYWMEMFGLRVRWAGRQQRYPGYSGSERDFGIESGSS